MLLEERVELLLLRSELSLFNMASKLLKHFRGRTCKQHRRQILSVMHYRKSQRIDHLKHEETIKRKDESGNGNREERKGKDTFQRLL